MGIMDIEVRARLNEEVVDIPTMRSFSAEGYRPYMEQYLFFIDHHGVLRSTLGQWPIAVTKQQVRELIDYLKTEALPRATDDYPA